MPQAIRQTLFAATAGLTLLAAPLAQIVKPTPAHAAIPRDSKTPLINPLQICSGAGVSARIAEENANDKGALRAWDSFCVGVYMAQYMAIIEPLAWQNAGAILKRYADKGEALDFTKDLIFPFKFTSQQQYDQYWKDVDVQTRKDFAEQRAALKKLPQFATATDADLNGRIAVARITVLQQLIETIDTAYRGEGKTFQPYHALLIAEELVRVKFEPSQFNIERYNSAVKAIEDKLPQKRTDAAPAEPTTRQYGSATPVLRQQAG